MYTQNKLKYACDQTLEFYALISTLNQIESYFYWIDGSFIAKKEKEIYMREKNISKNIPEK